MSEIIMACRGMIRDGELLARCRMPGGDANGFCGNHSEAQEPAPTPDAVLFQFFVNERMAEWLERNGVPVHRASHTNANINQRRHARKAAELGRKENSGSGSHLFVRQELDNVDLSGIELELKNEFNPEAQMRVLGARLIWQERDLYRYDVTFRKPSNPGERLENWRPKCFTDLVTARPHSKVSLYANPEDRARLVKGGERGSIVHVVRAEEVFEKRFLTEPRPAARYDLFYARGLWNLYAA